VLLTLQSELVSSLTEGQRLLVKVVKANGLLDSGSYTYVFKCMSPFYSTVWIRSSVIVGDCQQW